MALGEAEARAFCKAANEKILKEEGWAFDGEAWVHPKVPAPFPDRLLFDPIDAPALRRVLRIMATPEGNAKFATMMGVLHEVLDPLPQHLKIGAALALRELAEEMMRRLHNRDAARN